MHKRMLFYAALAGLILLAGCTQGPAPAPTLVPPTESPPTQTPAPTSTPLPAPTETPLPTETLLPTETPVPTSTPTPTATPPPMPYFEPAPCAFSLTTGHRVDCGYLVVPENRSKADSPPIRVHVAIFRSLASEPKPDPVIYVSGGGGVNQMAVYAHYMVNGGDEILKTRDYIMYNQRGAYLNTPSLVCPDDTALFWSLAGQKLPRREAADRKIASRLQCHDDLLAQGIDLTAYNTLETAADINDLRIALGYEQINLYGTSSGTRTILALMRTHPEGIRSVILDSVYPPQVDLYSTVHQSIYRVFNLLFETCAANPNCQAQYPNLETSFYATVDALNANPAELEFDRGTIYVDGGMFMEALYNRFYSYRNVAGLPYLIHHASQGDFRAMTNDIASLLSDPNTFFAIGFEWSLMCNEEVPFESYELGRERAAGLPPAIADYFDSYYEFTLCKSWQAGVAPPEENEPVVSDLPALVFAGEFDPVTPPEWGRMAAETLSNHFFYEFPGQAHGVMRANTCALQMGLQFLDAPSTAPDSSCMDSLPLPDF